MNFEAKNLAQALIDEVTRIPYDENLVQELLKKITATRDARIISFIIPLIWPVDLYIGALPTGIWTKTNIVPNHSPTRSAALQAITALLSQTLPEQLLAISGCWSDSVFVERIQQWITIEAPSVDQIEEGEAKLYLLGILSLAKNGYMRESAVISLAKYESPAALPFILCRTVDWVPEIRKKALDVLETKLIPANGGTFIQLLPLIGRLDLSSRAIKSLEDKVCDLYRSESGKQLLVAALKTERKNVRVQICCTLDKLAQDIPADILDIIAKDSDPSVRFWLTRWEERIRAFNPVKASQLRKILLHDASAKIRNIAILASLAAVDDDVYSFLYKSLFDKSPGIREMARYYIKQRETLDFSLLYRKMLIEKDPKLQIAIAGLGETGSSGDYEIILPLLAGSSRQTREALKALGKLDSTRAKQEQLRALADHRSAVRHLALKELPKRLPADYEKTLLNVWRLAASEEARCCVAKSMLCLPPWIAVRVLLRAMTIYPSQEAANALERWYPSLQKCYAPIPPDETEKIATENALMAAAPFLQPSVVDRVLIFLHSMSLSPIS
jgi:HEAT repeat protein